MDRSKRDRLAAALLTILLYAGIVAVCFFTSLRFPPAGEPLPQPRPEDDGLLFGGEYVMLGDDPALMVSDNDQAAPDEASDVPATEAVDFENAGEVGEAATEVTSEQPSPMKVKEKPKPEKAGPSKEEIAAREKARREKEAAERIRKSVQFSGKGSGKGSAGSPNGNSNTGAAAGSPGHDLAGRTIESFDSPASTLSGTVKIRVKVNAKGQVVSASYDGGSGPASASAAVRRSCVNASRRSRFSVRVDSDRDQSGVIIWRFK